MTMTTAVMRRTERMATAGTGAGAARGGWLLAAVRPVVSARTWLAIVHLLTGLVTGLVGFGLALIGIVGVALLILPFIGLPVLAATMALCAVLARIERARFASLLGVSLPAPRRTLDAAGGWWRRAWHALFAPARLRQFGYAALRFPLSFAEVAVVIGVWSLALVFVSMPAYNWMLPQGGAQVGGTVLRGAGPMIAAEVIGLLLLFAAPQCTRGIAAADTAIARYLIGPGSSADVSARIGELEQSRARVVNAAEAERRRIERDLHDGAQQRLVALAMDLGRARARFADDPEAARAILDQAHADAKEALSELRNLVRGVHPPVLTDRGLDAALSGLAALSPVPVTVRADVTARPSASVEAIAYFVVAEALTNVAKHAQATRAEVSVTRRGDVLQVVISDDGAGGADPEGQGLSGLADRVTGVDGRLSVASPAGGGTVIEAVLPCGS
jgi:signal transduction histidine kinase